MALIADCNAASERQGLVAEWYGRALEFNEPIVRLLKHGVSEVELIGGLIHPRFCCAGSPAASIQNDALRVERNDRCAMIDNLRLSVFGKDRSRHSSNL